MFKPLRLESSAGYVLLLDLNRFVWVTFLFQSANQDQLLIQWGEAASAIMNVNVVAAMLLLLGYPKPEGRGVCDRYFSVGHLHRFTTF